ncbi:hypothetical protein AAEH85_21565, partial [Shewanella algae]|uniref:hypothetical protein n=1 Tax=Shewanella algae TaxID=38313 RepID=UPI00313C23A6
REKKDPSNLSQEVEAIINSSDQLIWSIDKNFYLQNANPQFYTYIKQSFDISVSPGQTVLFSTFNLGVLNKWKAFYQRGLSGEQFSVRTKI